MKKGYKKMSPKEFIEIKKLLTLDLTTGMVVQITKRSPNTVMKVRKSMDFAEYQTLIKAKKEQKAHKLGVSGLPANLDNKLKISGAIKILQNVLESL